MKKLLLFIGITLAAFSNAQVIEKGDIIIQAGAGLGIYHYQFTDITNNVVNDRDTSGAWAFPVQVEYGINNWLGGAVSFTYNNFLIDDSTDGKASVTDVAPLVSLHIPWGLKHFDVNAQIGFGYSRFHYEIAQINNPVANANGTILIVGVNPRIYFGKNARFGITPWYRYSKHNYKEGTVSDDTNLEYKFKLEGPGNSFGLGLVFKL